MGATIPEAFLAMYLFETVCTIQVRAMAGGSELIHVDPRIIATAGEQARVAAERARELALSDVRSTAETLEATLEHMEVVEGMRRTLREIRDLNKLDVN